MSSQAIPGYGAVPMVSLRNPVSRTRAQEKRKRSRLEIEPGGALVQSRINTYLILSDSELSILGSITIPIDSQEQE